MALIRFSPVLLLAVTTCAQNKMGSAAQCALPPDAGITSATGLVRYCAPAELAQRSATVQFLVDGSGSMYGFGADDTTRLYEWVAQSFSQLRDLGMTFTRTRSAYFAAKKGITSASARLVPGPGHFEGDTNLHEAIATSRDYDLTVILTDGVAASGTGNGDCSGGVDAACVARALRQALSPRAGELQMPQGGFWLLPLVTMYSGIFFSEQILANSEFDDARATSSVRADTSTNAEIGKREQRQGRLAYSYKGPRTLFLLVLARRAETGRALVAALASRSAGAQIQQLGRLKDYGAGLAMLTPIEVFPGALSSPIWADGRVGTKNYKPAVCGVMDLVFQAPDQLRIDCPNGSHTGILELTIRADVRASQCVQVAVLPTDSLSLSGNGSKMIEGFAWRPGGSGLAVKLTCQGEWRIPCGDGAAMVDWTLVPNYRASADLVVRGSPALAAVLIKTLSTNEPAYQPVRVPAFSALLEKFYREIAGWQITLPYTRLRLCR